MMKFIAKKVCNSLEKKYGTTEKIEKGKERYIEEIRHNQKRIAKTDAFCAKEMDTMIETIRDAKSLYEVASLISNVRSYIRKSGHEYFEINQK